MSAYLTTVLAAVGAWAAHFTPAQLVIIGLVLLLLAALVLYWLEDYWLAVEKAFQGRGVGRDDMADTHKRTWPEYWS